MTAQPHTLPLSALSIDKVNVRKADTGADPVMMASIQEKGILVPLIVRPNGKGYLVTDGGKRLASMQKLKFAADYQVPVVIREISDSEAHEQSLTTNMVRAQMHPIDEFEAIAELYRGGKGLPLADIGKRFGMKEKEVRQSLALGTLHIQIREAFRKDEIDEDAARAFTLETDQSRQLEIFKGRGGKQEWSIRKVIVGEESDGAKYLRFVGRDAYEAAGGKVIEDLFSEREGTAYPNDLKLLKKMADEKLKKKIDDLKAKGWKWVENAADLSYSHQMWAVDKKAPKEKSGVVVELTHNGTLSIREHLLKPSDAKTKTKKSGEGKPVERGMSQTLVQRMSESMTLAAGHALGKEPHVALAAAVASLQSHDCCVTLTHNGVEPEGEFETILKRELKKTDKQLMADFALLMGNSLSFRTQDAENLPFAKDNDNGAGFLLNALDADEVTGQFQEEFDLEDYFNSVSKDTLGEAIKEAINPDEYRKIAHKPKAEIAKFCIANISAKNWLPEELRVKGYKVTKARAR